MSSIFIPSDCAHFSSSLKERQLWFLRELRKTVKFMQVKVRAQCHFSHCWCDYSYSLRSGTKQNQLREREKKVSRRHTHCWLLNEWKGSVLSVCNSLISCSEEVQPNGSRVSFMVPELMAPCVLYQWTFIMLSCHHNFFLRHEQLDKRNAQNKSSIELWVIGEESE